MWNFRASVALTACLITASFPAAAAPLLARIHGFLQTFDPTPFGLAAQDMFVPFDAGFVIDDTTQPTVRIGTFGTIVYGYNLAATRDFSFVVGDKQFSPDDVVPQHAAGYGADLFLNARIEAGVSTPFNLLLNDTDGELSFNSVICVPVLPSRCLVLASGGQAYDSTNGARATFLAGPFIAFTALPAIVPEPGTDAVLALGLLTMVCQLQRAKRRNGIYRRELSR